MLSFLRPFRPTRPRAPRRHPLRTWAEDHPPRRQCANCGCWLKPALGEWIVALRNGRVVVVCTQACADQCEKGGGA